MLVVDGRWDVYSLCKANDENRTTESVCESLMSSSVISTDPITTCTGRMEGNDVKPYQAASLSALPMILSYWSTVWTLVVREKVVIVTSCLTSYRTTTLLPSVLVGRLGFRECFHAIISHTRYLYCRSHYRKSELMCQCKKSIVWCVMWHLLESYVHGTVLYCTVLYCTVLYYTILYYTILYCTVLVLVPSSRDLHDAKTWR